MKRQYQKKYFQGKLDMWSLRPEKRYPRDTHCTETTKDLRTYPPDSSCTPTLPAARTILRGNGSCRYSQ